jgi:hypothetical protein
MSRRKEPKVRQAPEGGWPKTPHAAVAQGVPRKQPQMRKFAVAEPDGKVVVQFGRFDVDGPWCLSKITPDDHRNVLTKIRDIETMTVKEVFNNTEEPGKDYDVNRLPTSVASKRLAELEYDDETKISRLRMSGTGRLYGFRRGERFYALWWDPEHKIWPSSGR